MSVGLHADRLGENAPQREDHTRPNRQAYDVKQVRRVEELRDAPPPERNHEPSSGGQRRKCSHAAKHRAPERKKVECSAQHQNGDADGHHAEEVEEAVERDSASKDEKLRTVECAHVDSNRGE